METKSLWTYVGPGDVERTVPSKSGGSYIKRPFLKSVIVTNFPPEKLKKLDWKYDVVVEVHEKDNCILLKILHVFKKEVEEKLEGSTFKIVTKTIHLFPEEREEVEEKKYNLISHPEVNEGGFGFFAALLSEITRLEKEIKEIEDELDRKKGDYMLSDLPTLASIASFLPSLPAIICGCGAVHFPSPNLGWWHQSCPSCGNRWKVEGQWVFRGGGGSPPLITPIAPHPYEDDEGGSSSVYITTISAEKPIIYVCSNTTNLLPKENVILVDVGKVQYYNNLLRELETKKQELEKKRQELESSEWEEYKAAVDDLIKYGGILICEGKCAVVYRDGDVECYSPNPNINTIELACFVKTAVKYFRGEV